ncbi:hypothetical protein [Burkholderia metallica]|uniref:hypothetical protein n=1 Tax=Burkholderia metallica TaxID=488729 RepID=UPI003B9679BA
MPQVDAVDHCTRRNDSVYPASFTRHSNSMKNALHELNRLSRNTATVAHDSHKGDRAAFFRKSGSTRLPLIHAIAAHREAA